MQLRGGATPLDIGVIAFCCVCHAATLAAAALIWLRRSYPPFYCRNVPLMTGTALGALVWWLGLLSNNLTYDLILPGSAGHLECGLLATLSFGGLGVTIGTMFIRVRVFHAIYVLRKRRLWPQPAQILVMMPPFLVPIIMAFGDLAGAHYSPALRACYNPPYGMYLCSLYILSLTVALTRMLLQLRKVRKQVDIYQDLRLSVLYSYVHIPSFAVLAMFVQPIAPLLARNLFLLYNIVVVAMAFWAVAYRPLRAILTSDHAYRDRYTQGYDHLLTPAMLREKLEHQLTVPALREQFLAFASKRQAQENVAFYAAVLERDETEDYFTRIAMSMDIIDTFIRPGAPQEVNLSQDVRDEILNGQPDRADLFEHARIVVLGLMETNLKDDFEDSHEYQALQTAAAQAEAEQTMLSRFNLQHSDRQASRLNQDNKSTSSTGSLRTRVLSRLSVRQAARVDNIRRTSHASTSGISAHGVSPEPSSPIAPVSPQ